MANNTLETRIIICNDTTVNWGTSTKVLLKGEIGIEFLADGTPKFKIGNGTDTFANLPYATMTQAEITTAINNAISAANHTHSNKSILDAIQVALTNSLKTNYDAAYTHSTQAHAPSNAEKNIIVGVQRNGIDVAVNADSRKVNISVPTKTSELQNDSGFKTTDNDTTYNLGASTSATNGNVKIKLTGSDTTEDAVTVKGAGSVAVTSDASGNVVITGTDTKYTHPNSGVTAGTYKSVTVDAKGHVTAGTNPTTLSGYGISDAYTKAQTNQEITTAIANADHLKRKVVTAIPSASEADENTIYMIKDSSVTGNDKYKEYMKIDGAVVMTGDTSVDLSDYTTKDYVDGLAGNYATKAQGTKADTAVQSVKIGDTEYKSGTNVVLPVYPTTLPASDVHDWAKAETKPTYTSKEVGLGNVTNNKQVKGLASGTTADHVVTWGADGYTVKDSGFMIGASVPANAKFTDTTYSIATLSKTGLVKSATGINNVSVAGDGVMSVASVSTDILSQGSNVLILDGGGAN